MSYDIQINVERSTKDIELTVEKGGQYIFPYAGPYHVTPTLYFQQRLETNGKSMSEDVLVDSIRVTESHNPQGGKTIIIG